MTEKMKDLVKQITAMLTAIMMFLGALGYTFEQFNPNTIEALGIVLTSLIPLGVTLYGVYMNTFAGKNAFTNAHEREAKRLIEEGKFDPNEGVLVEELDVPAEAEDGADL
jgi:hypothetical protein